ncbi:MAG TPA: sulfurtransferase TusA family protein [Tissierellaceae bacterium]|nr:sulfurtransferase TusA family protein [Tissierellaceae bacterium]
MNIIDTCGMACPQPVLMTKKALDKTPSGVDIIVDNNTARENLERFLSNGGYSISMKEDGDLFILEARK